MTELSKKTPDLSLLVPLCELLPLSITLLEIEGSCSVNNPNCQFAQKALDDKSKQLCTKKTYTPLQLPVLA